MYRYGAKVCPDMQTVSPRSEQRARLAGEPASTHCCSQQKRGQACPAAAWQLCTAPNRTLAAANACAPKSAPRPPLADSLVLTAVVRGLSPAARHLPTWGVLLHDTRHV